MSSQQQGTAPKRSANALVLVAVMPEYRRHFLNRLRELTDDDVVVAAGQEHLIATVKTSSDRSLGIVPLRNRFWFGRRLYWQSGALRLAWSPRTVITDLNPRSITAWLVLLMRRISGRRTLVWGHVLPRLGADARTVPLRRFMRRLADGVISYTWSDRHLVLEEDPGTSVWVAANGLYPAGWLRMDQHSVRDSFIYVGRLVEEKKPTLMLNAFAKYVSEYPDSTERLIVVGDGPEREALVASAVALGLSTRVDFLGEVSDYERLRDLYARCIASLSPGYAGLSLTQSLGFGVPMLIARSEPHAPEIELFSDRSGLMFESDNPSSMAAALATTAKAAPAWADSGPELVRLVAQRYSADAMAEGFVDAILDQRSESGSGHA